MGDDMGTTATHAERVTEKDTKKKTEEYSWKIERDKENECERGARAWVLDERGMTLAQSLEQPSGGR
eukprot:3939594-Rhodomonas_salina.1